MIIIALGNSDPAQGGQYTPIDHITPGVTCSVVGIVLDVGATRTTRTGGKPINFLLLIPENYLAFIELSKSFALVDPSKCDGSGITVNIFASQSDEELLPSARWGQVLLLRNVKVSFTYSIYRITLARTG